MKKTLTIGGISIAAFLSVIGAASVFAVGTNGSFEIGTDPGTFTTLIPGNTNITDWAIDSGSIDYIGTYWQASDGVRSIDLNGLEKGSVSQTIPTVVGATYDVSFDLSGNPDSRSDVNDPYWSPSNKEIVVSATGASPQSFTYDTAVKGNSLSDMKWEKKTYSFVATGVSTTVTFASNIPGAFGPALDNVSIAESNVPTSSTVHMFKYIDGAQATTENAGGVNFPMFTSTYNVPFTLGPGGWTTGDIAYEASTAPMPIGSSYSANENLATSLVGTSCDGIHQYALVGYSVGNTLLEAQNTKATLDVPSFTNLLGDKYIIVQNHLCPPIQTIKVHILKYLDGVKADVTSAGGYQFPMTATWQTSNLNGGVSTSGNYVLGNNHGGAPDQYGADTSPMNIPANYTTSEITDSSSQVVSSLETCVPGKYLLNGYRTSAVDFATAATQSLTVVAPVFTGLTSDQYVIVDNSKCPVGGTISGMKYNDLNRNGKKDEGEPGLQGWVIRLLLDNEATDEDTVIATATTDEYGNYSFQNVAPGTYEVRETYQKGWKRMSKNPKDIVITAGSVFANIDFGNARKQKKEREDNDEDDNRDEQSGKNYGNHGDHHDQDHSKGDSEHGDNNHSEHSPHH